LAFPPAAAFNESPTDSETRKGHRFKGSTSSALVDHAILERKPMTADISAQRDAVIRRRWKQ
jgi:hypothetical protein